MNETMIKKHEDRLNEITGELLTIMGDSMVPTAALVIAKIKKLAAMMGISSVSELMSYDENDLQERFCLMPSDQQAEAEGLVEEINELIEGTVSQSEVMERMTQEADIIQNVLAALGVDPMA